MEPTAAQKPTETLERCVSALSAVGEPTELSRRLRAAAAVRDDPGSLLPNQIGVLVLITADLPSHLDTDPAELVRSLVAGDQLATAAVRYLALREVPGWAAANRRGRALERLLILLAARLCRLGEVSEPLDLLLRGSGGQGLPAIHSDVDFELSGPRHPGGHERLERAIEVLLGGLGIDAEGSSGRPTNHDLVGAENEHRELHEWMELRRAGATGRDQGWVAAHFSGLPADWWRRPSIYELEGRRATPKYAFFEARALVARLSLLKETGAGTTQTQLRALRHLGLNRPVMCLEQAISTCLELYERPDDGSRRRLSATQESLQQLRERFSLPGPDLSMDAEPDSRRSALLLPGRAP